MNQLILGYHFRDTNIRNEYAKKEYFIDKDITLDVELAYMDDLDPAYDVLLLNLSQKISRDDIDQIMNLADDLANDSDERLWLFHEHRDSNVNRYGLEKDAEELFDENDKSEDITEKLVTFKGDKPEWAYKVLGQVKFKTRNEKYKKKVRELKDQDAIHDELFSWTDLQKHFLSPKKSEIMTILLSMDIRIQGIKEDKDFLEHELNADPWYQKSFESARSMAQKKNWSELSDEIDKLFGKESASDAPVYELLKYFDSASSQANIKSKKKVDTVDRKVSENSRFSSFHEWVLEVDNLLRPE